MSHNYPYCGHLKKKNKVETTETYYRRPCCGQFSKEKPEVGNVEFSERICKIHDVQSQQKLYSANLALIKRLEAKSLWWKVNDWFANLRA